MLNLQKLEQTLDAALANETPESLTSWLLSQRAMEAVATANASAESTISMTKVEATFRSTGNSAAKFRDEAHATTAGLYDYAMAA